MDWNVFLLESTLSRFSVSNLVQLVIENKVDVNNKYTIVITKC